MSDTQIKQGATIMKPVPCDALNKYITILINKACQPDRYQKIQNRQVSEAPKLMVIIINNAGRGYFFRAGIVFKRLHLKKHVASPIVSQCLCPKPKPCLGQYSIINTKLCQGLHNNSTCNPWTVLYLFIFTHFAFHVQFCVFLFHFGEEQVTGCQATTVAAA